MSVPGPVSAAQCTASGAGLSSATAGVAATFKVLLYDASGNAVSTAVPASLAATLTAGGVPTVAGSAHSDDVAANGVTVTYVVTVATTYTLTITWQGQTISGGVTTVTAGPGEGPEPARDGLVLRVVTAFGRFEIFLALLKVGRIKVPKKLWSRLTS